MSKTMISLIKRACLILLIVNIIYLSVSLVFYERSGDSITSTIKNSIYQPSYSEFVHLDSETGEKESLTDYSKEIQELLKEVGSNKHKYWLTDTDVSNTRLEVNANDFINNSQSENAWVNKNEVYYDPRLTLSLYINYIKHNSKGQENEKTLELPFNWADWVDLSMLNEDLSKSINERRDCNWIKKFTRIDQSSDISAVKCMDNSDLSPKLIESLGYDRHEQLPGFIVYDYCDKRAFNDIRIAQGKSHVFSFMDNPYKLLFLNKNGGTYEVNVKGNDGKKKVAESGLMNEYLLNNFKNQKSKLKKMNKPNTDLSIELDPTKEFKSLKETIEPSFLKPSEDPYNMYKLLHDKGETTSRDLPLPKEAFRYSPSIVHEKFTLLERLRNLQELSRSETAFYESIVLSDKHNGYNEPAYFKMSTLAVNGDARNVDKDQGWHYDWRFFNGALNYQRNGWTQEELSIRTNIILDRLLRNWFRFAEEKGIVSWIMHGPLLSWFWNGLVFPFDNDIDIQIPVKELVRLGENFNQTLVIEDAEEGYGKYLIDVGTYVHNRDISITGNHIDARFIDVDSGIYIDITGLSFSNAIPPNEYYDKGVFDKQNQQEIYNDRRKHYYTLDQLSLLKYSMVGGVPVYIPNKLCPRLNFEYPHGLTKPEFQNWHFVPKLGLWLSEKQLTQAFDVNEYSMALMNENGINKSKMMELVVDMSDEEMYRLLKSDELILSEFYNTRKWTKLHHQEQKFLFDFKLDQLAQSGEENIQITDNANLNSDEKLKLEYNKFVNKNFHMGKASTPPLFQYENFLQPLHHKKSSQNT